MSHLRDNSSMCENLRSKIIKFVDSILEARTTSCEDTLEYKPELHVNPQLGVVLDLKQQIVAPVMSLTESKSVPLVTLLEDRYQIRRL